MRRLLPFFALLLLLTGCAGQTGTPESGLKVTIRAGGVYSVACSTEYHTEVGQNADNSVLTPDSSLYFSPAQGKALYTVSVADAAGRTLAKAQLTDDFSQQLVELTVTQDLEFLYN